MFVLLAAVVVSVVGGSGNIKEQVRPVEPFHAIDAGYGITVTVTAGAEQRVSLRTDDNLHPLIHTDVRDGVLFIGIRKPIRPSKGANVAVSARVIDSISVSNGADVQAQMAPVEKLAIKGASGARITVNNVDAERVTANFSGGTTFTGSGRAKAATLTASGGANLRAAQLAVEELEVEFTEGVNAHVRANKKLGGYAVGGVNIKTAGKAEASIDATGGSNVTPE